VNTLYSRPRTQVVDDNVFLTQAKEHEIYDTAPFLQSRLFIANGYTLNSDVIEKRFK
jgi:DNA replication licensing factor MCM2